MFRRGNSIKNVKTENEPGKLVRGADRNMSQVYHDAKYIVLFTLSASNNGATEE